MHGKRLRVPKAIWGAMNHQPVQSRLKHVSFSFFSAESCSLKYLRRHWCVRLRSRVLGARVLPVLGRGFVVFLLLAL